MAQNSLCPGTVGEHYRVWVCRHCVYYRLVSVCEPEVRGTCPNVAGLQGPYRHLQEVLEWNLAHPLSNTPICSEHFEPSHLPCVLRSWTDTG